MNNSYCSLLPFTSRPHKIVGFQHFIFVFLMHCLGYQSIGGYMWRFRGYCFSIYRIHSWRFGQVTDHLHRVSKHFLSRL
jgi:hypothetical protein